MKASRLYRVLRLVTILQGGTLMSAVELAKELGVSRRTLFRDLHLLEAAGVPYEHQVGHGYRDLLGRLRDPMLPKSGPSASAPQS